MKMELAEAYQTLMILMMASALITFIGFTRESRDVHRLIISDMVAGITLVIVAAVGTDLAECLILPTLVVSVAEVLAIAEILIHKEEVKLKESSQIPSFSYSPLNIEVLQSSSIFVSLVLIVYGAILTGFTGGAVAGVGMLYYLITRWDGKITRDFWDGISSLSGVAWTLWLVGFLLFFISPELWLFALFLSGGGLVIKVATKFGLIGVEGRDSMRGEG
ncbi:MAG: energy-converting hydrogenase subunit [Archaeoglobi archaeon]|nr:energy-converting hydrogenase subunit [Archaeoglobi archaeon]